MSMLQLSREQKISLAIITGLFAVNCLLCIAIFPSWDLPDERDHYQYAQFLSKNHSLPPLYPDGYIAGEPPPVVMSYNPPLYYLLCAPIVGSDMPYVRQYVNYKEHRIGTTYDGPEEYRGRYEARLLVGRAFSFVATFVMIFILSYVSVRFFAENRWSSVLFVALFALNPKIVQFSAAFNPEVIAADLTAIVVCVTMMACASSTRTWSTVLLLGISTGLALLVRLTSFSIVGFLAVFFVITITRKRTSRVFRGALCVTLVVLAIAGWWYVRNAVLYCDPFCVRTLEQDAAAKMTLSGTEHPEPGMTAIAILSHSFSSFGMAAVFIMFFGLAGIFVLLRDFHSSGRENPGLFDRLALSVSAMSACAVLAALTILYFMRTGNVQGRYLIVGAVPAALAAAIAGERFFGNKTKPIVIAVIAALQLMNMVNLFRVNSLHNS